MNIYLDFDGTVVEHEFPKIGRFNPNALEVIKKLQDAGHKIYLNTARCEAEYSRLYPDCLKQAVNYIQLHPRVEDIFLAGVTTEKFHPHPWDEEKLATAGDIFIDDMASGIPLCDAGYVSMKMVDWVELERQLIKANIIPSC